MEGTLEDSLVKEPSQDSPDLVKDIDEVLPNGVNGDCIADVEHSDEEHEQPDEMEDKTDEGMDIDETQDDGNNPDDKFEDEEEIDAPDNVSLVDATETNETNDNDNDNDNDIQITGDISDSNIISEVTSDADKYKDTSCEEIMDIDHHSSTSDIECLDEAVVETDDNVKTVDVTEVEDITDDIIEDEVKNDDDPLNESVETISSMDNSDLKIVEENGGSIADSIGSPDIEEITDTKSNGHNISNERSPNSPKKKQRSKVDLSNITPRRSSRNIKRTSYIEKEPDEPEADDGSDIEEIKLEDPLACVGDGKDKENTKLKSQLKSNKTTIVVSDTKRLVEIAAGSKCSKGGKKEPTLVIIDTNSILSGRGGVPVSSSKSQPVSSSSAFSVMPVNLTGTSTMYSNMRTTITPVPMSSKSASQLSPKLGSNIIAIPTQAPSTATSTAPSSQAASAPILPTLTDDMFVVEAPSFIVPYVYEKPPVKPLKEFVVKLEKCIEERDREDREKEEKEKLNKDDSSEHNDSEIDEDIIISKKDSGADSGGELGMTPKNPDDGESRADDRNKVQTYFDLPLGKFFMQIGVNLVQEFVQTDLLRQQKHKQRKGGQASAETQIAINSLIKNLEFSKENNEPFHLEMKKCEFCSFKTESSLVMQHHLETPHMRNYVYKCNFCPLEVRSPHDILYHMEAEHNTRGRLERGPAFHQCPNCPFEDNQKGKLTRHILTCAKKFRPERNLEPSGDWEPPAKIPRLNRPRPVGPLNTNAIAMAMGGKGAQPLLPKLLPAPIAGRGRGRPPMQPRYADMKSLRQGPTSVRQDNVAAMMYRPTSSGLLVPTSYQFGSNQLFQNTSITASKNPAAKLLSQPSISITPLPRTTIQPPISGSGSSSKPGSKNSFVICEICDGYIKDLEQLRNHMQWIHKVKIHPKMIYNRPPLNCQKCQFRFFTDQGLERHLLGSHGLVTSSMQEAANKGKDAGRCPACGRSDMAVLQRNNWLADDDGGLEQIGDGGDSDYSDVEPQLLPEEDDESSSDEADALDLSKYGTCFWDQDKSTTEVPRPTPGVKEQAKDAKTPISSWELFFPTETIEKIVEHTNQKLELFQPQYDRPRDCSLTSVAEIKALFGLLYLSGSMRMAQTHIRDLWATDGMAPPYFRAVMSVTRFSLLLRALRFDNAETREERKRNDKLAAIREIWDDVNDKFSKMYCLGEGVTINEMMLAFKGRCSFRQCVPMKPNRYGLKIFGIVDAGTYYTSNIEIYGGKQPLGEFEFDYTAEEEVERLSGHNLDAAQNLAIDNWFSSVPLIDELKNTRLTAIVDTLKKNKIQIPPELMNHRTREVYSSLIGYNDDKVLVSYIPKKNKCVLRVLSMHTSENMDSTGKERRPEIITFYDRAMSGMDTVDRLRGDYSVARFSCRWPLTAFFGLLDLAMINSQIIYSENMKTTMQRKNYMKSIAKDLTKPWMVLRLQKSQLPLELRTTIMKFAGVTKEEQTPADASRGVCYYCPRKKNRKTKTKCCVCSKLVCGEHTRQMCATCFDCESSS